MQRFHRGECLVTLATGEMSQGEADRAGLVQTHAYAMLDIREVKVGIIIIILPFYDRYGRVEYVLYSYNIEDDLFNIF